MHHRLRTSALAVATVLLAALSLSSCATPAPTFHLVGIDKPPAPYFVDEMFAGDYTVAADNPSNVADLRWDVAWGLLEQAPGLYKVKTVDGVPAIPVTLVADPSPYGYGRYFQICLSSIAQPTAKTCKTIKVGDVGLWNGGTPWVARNAPDGKPYELHISETGRTLHITVLDGSTPILTTDATLLSPFTSEFTLPDSSKGNTYWRSWFDVDVTFPPSIFGGFSVSFSRNEVPTI